MVAEYLVTSLLHLELQASSETNYAVHGVTVYGAPCLNILDCIILICPPEHSFPDLLPLIERTMLHIFSRDHLSPRCKVKQNCPLQLGNCKN